MPFRVLSIRLVCLIAAFVTSGVAAGQVKYPAAPEKYRVEFRYRIRADRDERIRQYRAMQEHMNKIGFVADPREDADLDIFDPTAERLTGTIAAANAEKLLDDPRVKTVLLMPASTPLPDDASRLLPIRVRLQAGLEPAEQQSLHQQAATQLARLGLIENIGYDHRGHTLVRGSLAAGKVSDLLRDLRDVPGGWFAVDTPRDRLPLPLRSLLPVRLVEVLPDVAGLTPSLPITPMLGKLTADVRAVLADPAQAAKPLRVEFVLTRALDEELRVSRAWIRNLFPGASIEGSIGSIVTARLPAASDAVKLALLPEIVAVRLPRAGVETIRPAGAGAKPVAVGEALAAAKVNELHARGYRGAGQRIVIVAAEFPGLAGLVGTRLPKGTLFVDLTAEQSEAVEPTPATGSASGIPVVLAAHAAAPDAGLVLVRVDPAAFHQMLTVAKMVLGESGYSEAIRARSRELVDESETLLRRRDIVVDEYREAFSDLSDEDKPTKRREAAQKAFEKLKADEGAFKAKSDRVAALRAGLDRLTGATVVVNTLVWEAGYPHDGMSQLSQILTERFVTTPTRTGLAAQRLASVPVWVQAGSDSIGSVWAGPFLDADANGVMEFTAEGTKLPSGLWTSELNFLGSVGADGMLAADLPAGRKLRFTIQWREPLPTDPAQPAPVFSPSLRLVRQLDPTGTTAATDEFSEVTRSVGVPVRIQLNPASAVYEQTLEATLPAAGRYALRIEGQTRAAGRLPGLSRTIEVQPRLVVSPLDASPGRVVFATFAPQNAGVGIAGDSSAAVAVGALAPDGVSPGGLTGAGPGVTLRPKPDVLVPAVVVGDGPAAVGSGVAAGFAGGVTASLLSAGVRPEHLTRTLGFQSGERLVLPQAWLDSLSPR